jgi:hypothetical protein
LLVACGTNPSVPTDALVNTPTDSPAIVPDASCTSDRECSALGGVCNRATSRCVECNATTDCASTQACVSNRCVATTRCTTSRMCPGRVCSARLGVCVDCDTDVDCTGGTVCQMNVCVASPGACRASRDCSGATRVCDTARGRCVGCLATTDCAAGEVCRDAACVRTMCAPGSVSCPAGGVIRTTCNADGLGARTETCPTPAHATGARCAANACAFDCAPGFADCDGDAANGCEADLDTTTDCGRCGAVCTAGQRCVMGACGAPPSRYEVSALPTTEEYIDACALPGATRVLDGADDVRVAVELAFPFRYWSSELTAGTVLNWTTNGYLQMNEVRTALPVGRIPDADTPNGVVAAYWGDLINVREQCHAVMGTAPARRQVFEWPDTHHCCPAMMPQLSIEVVLHERTHLIDFLYRSRVGMRAFTVGIENETGTAAVSPCPMNSMCIPASNYRFTPSP